MSDFTMNLEFGKFQNLSTKWKSLFAFINNENDPVVFSDLMCSFNTDLS